MGRVRIWLAVLAKLAVTFGLLAWLFSGIDWAILLEQFSVLSVAPLLLAFVLLFLTVPLVAARWHHIVALMGGAITMLQSFRMVLMTVLVNACVPSNLGGDAYRIVATSQLGLPWKRAVLGAIVDRTIALSALGLIVLIGLFTLLDHAGFEDLKLLAVGGTCLLALGIAAAWAVFRSQLKEWLAGRADFLRRLIEALGDLVNEPGPALYLLFLALVVQLLTVGVMAIIAFNAAVDVPFVALVSVCALGILIARMPISYGGWGVREGALVFGFAPFGVPREVALAASISYGLCELSVAIASGITWAILTVATSPGDQSVAVRQDGLQK